MPGKFPDEIAEALYDLSMDGTDEQLGDVQETGIWYGRFSGVTPSELEERGVNVEGFPDEMFFVLTEDDQGFVDYEQYDTEEELDARWGQIENEIEEFYQKQAEEDMEPALSGPTYENIVFLQGEEADEAMNILTEAGEDEAFSHMLDTYGHLEGELTDEPPWGEEDDVYEKIVGYETFFLSYNTRLGYIGLTKKGEE